MPIPAGFPGTFAFVDALPIPQAVNATAGGTFDFEIVPAYATLHSMLPAPMEPNCWTAR